MNVMSETQTILINIGIPTNLLGFMYISYAEQVLLQHPEYMRKITVNLYNDIAEHFNTSPVSVERCIRHAISVGWTQGDANYIETLFKVKGTPTNTQFLSRLYFYLINKEVA